MHLKKTNTLYFFKKFDYLKLKVIIYLQNNQEIIKLNQKNQQKTQIKIEINLNKLKVLIDIH
jgi:hypothetical protein